MTLRVAVQNQGDPPSFLAESTELLKQNAPYQLIWTGEVGLDSNPTPYGTHASVLATYQLDGLLSGQWYGSWSNHLTQTEANISSFVIDPDLLYSSVREHWNNVGQIWIRRRTRTMQIRLHQDSTMRLPPTQICHKPYSPRL